MLTIITAGEAIDRSLGFDCYSDRRQDVVERVLHDNVTVLVESDVALALDFVLFAVLVKFHKFLYFDFQNSLTRSLAPAIMSFK